VKRWRLLSAGVLALVLLAVATWQVSRARCFQLVGEVICRVETSKPVVALTFDDGPRARGVDAVLAELEPRGIKATFFLIGNEIERNPGLAERLVQAGHELGNHSTSHKRMVGRLPAFHTHEIARTDALLRAAGASPTLFRPPYGKRLIGLPLAAERAGYRIITADVEDSGLETLTPQAYADAMLAQVRPGSILLMHPMYGPNQTARDALPLILDGLTARGYQVTTVSGLLAAAKAPAP
jgi:peptidoglycan/xylan/chitin deacetylase (PgdA/CDA1 family)